VRLAVDSDVDAVQVYQANFPSSHVERGLVEDWFDGRLGSKPTKREREVAGSLGTIDVLLGGPPCQGHSDLNNHTRRDDERNALYARMARAAEVLRPAIVLVENVPTVQHDVEDIVEITMKALSGAGYDVAEAVVDLLALGVPQRRRRHVILAIEGPGVDASQVFDLLGLRCAVHPQRSVRWAIEDLVGVRSTALIDAQGMPSPKNERRMRWLFRHDQYDLPNRLRPVCHQSDHSYRSMYGRLRWDEPAQTVTTGFGSMGQGRYVHPGVPRTITAHEAARLQMLPDFLDFGQARTRSAIARLVGNAVPPSLSLRVAELVLPLVAKAHPINSNGRHRTRAGTPEPSSEDVARRMRATRQSDTAAEKKLRRAMDRARLEYEVNVSPVRGLRSRVDFVFSEERVAVYVDGCFWHGCPQHATWPKSNAEWWRQKLTANQRRDVAATRALESAGWRVLRFWAHDHADASAEIIAKEVRRRTPARVAT
jgi:DNA (cytosine-5)-methyltransferase 1